MILETERLQLRRLSVDDAEFILRLLNEPSFIQNIGDRGVRTVDDARGYIVKGPITSYEKFGFGLWMVETRSPIAPIGICGLLKRDVLDDVEFIIAGEDKSHNGEHRQDFEDLINKLNLNQHVRLVGWVDDVAKLLPTLDLFVSPARSEPFGLSIVEAMAAGVTVVATMSEGAQEIIEDHKTGCLVPLRDVEAMAKAISELLSDPEERVRLSRNAQRAVRERFSLERMLSATEQVYRDVLKERSAS